MYAEIFGIQEASAAVENAAQWVQWVQAGINAGATENESAIRYNLDQFWKAKAAAYPGESEAGRTQLERLDTWAQGFWQALETGKIYSATPSYWSFWKKYWTGGTPDRPEAIAAATTAATAAVRGQEAAKRAGGNFGLDMSNLASRTSANLTSELEQAGTLWNQKGIAPLGIPIWAWIAGAAALGILFLSQRGK